MAFYKMGYQEMMALPLRVFWFMDNCIGRIEAQDRRASLSVAVASQSEEAYEMLVEDLDKRIGEAIVFDQAAILAQEKLDEEGLNELRNMAF